MTFAREAEQKFLAEHEFLQRTDQQFHWRNQDYGSFDDFLATLNSRHRKAIKRERREAVTAGITIHPLTGRDITEDAWGRVSTISTWRPVRANGAGPI